MSKGSSSSGSSSSKKTTSTSSSSNQQQNQQPNVELIEKLAATPLPIALPPSYKPEAKFEKYVNQFVGKIIMSAAIISKVPGSKLKNTLLAQKGLLIKLNEVIAIIDGVNKGNLHLELLSVSGTKYIITTIKPRSWYGLNTNLNVGGGLIVVSLEKYILMALYPASVLPIDAIPYVENYVINTIL
ncbi:hypothetical protein DICPUDRAFT_77699 [Dictyostelium purpureum]|uniref:Uncharacterized protein n=1 Tax=Dictyostelium purpureum TaxID=5786 RepID=F0ZHD5_DICPU|nr:uncharacterized protein DICPUDRAFT_77699 [Dictyostelium purpureum]EGC36651.1 hypothetical protein DICPUDRAFT_77699 [Dictyostelium purpureum]|eukprot:XP_003286819.1 hypothetical protein DICPUDRAFT_77699 [Dictyostelium purpureum]